jgi:3-oxoacyl-[acyl-carrier protein] reductase
MAQDSPLSGKVALVTGGGQGIGAAIAEKLAALGAAAVIICGRSKDPLQHTADRLRANGGSCQAIQCDVTSLESVERLAAEVSQQHKRLDVLVNNAGIGGFGGPLHRLSPDDWDRVLNTNLRGVYYMIRAFAPLVIAAGGHIINISSIAGKNALPNGAAYAASKWGLNGLSYSVAEELRGHNVRVSVICPGSTHTDLSPHEGKDPGRMLQAGDVAHLVAMLVTQAPQSFASEIVLRPTQKP